MAQPESLFTGRCLAMFAFDVGFAIDLAAAEAGLDARDAGTREAIRRPRRTPRSFEYDPPPLRVVQPAAAIEILGGQAASNATPGTEAVGGTGWKGAARTEATIEVTAFDFGAVSVAYEVVLPSGGVSLRELLTLSNAMYENTALLAAAESAARRCVERLNPCVERPSFGTLSEDYVIFDLKRVVADGGEVQTVLNEERRALAQILRAEQRDLSEQEIEDAVSVRLSYGKTDAALIDWHAAVLLETGDDPEASADAVQVLEFVNVELLEMRHLDDQLDDSLEEAYSTVKRRRSGGARVELAHIAELQIDASLVFEGVNNALKLVGDQYLARLYRLAAIRMHLPDWDASIIRKLGTLESLYEKLCDRQSVRRMEILEWIIIILIAVSIVIPFLPGFSGK